MLTATLFMGLQVFGAPVAAIVETQLADQSRLHCSAVYEREGRSGRISLARSDRWTLEIIDHAESSERTARPTFVTVNGIRTRFSQQRGAATRIASFPSTSDFVGQLARQGTIAVQYEFEVASQAVAFDVTLSPLEREAWSGCITTLALFDRYSH